MRGSGGLDPRLQAPPSPRRSPRSPRPPRPTAQGAADIFSSEPVFEIEGVPCFWINNERAVDQVVAVLKNRCEVIGVDVEGRNLRLH